MAKQKEYKSKLALKMGSSGITSIEMAQKLNVREMSVIHHERKGIKTLRKAAQYAKILKCDPLEVIG